MKRKITGLFLLAGLLAATAVTAHAETYNGKSNWHVAFTEEKKMESNFTTQDLSEATAGLQPGDNIYLTVTLQNQYGQATDWYMRNDIRESLEDASKTAKGGAYTYVLTYTDEEGNTTELFNSDTVGGDEVSEGGEGLNEATSALAEYFYLDNLKTGQTGKINLEVGLDGVTQGNDYQDTLAKLELSFAVEINDTPTPRREPGDSGQPEKEVIKTGDEQQPLVYLLLMAVSGLLFLFLGISNVRRNRKERKGEAR